MAQEPVEPQAVDLPWISVIIPTYGQKGVALVDNCLRSLRATHSHLDFLEIFVVSDGPEGYVDIIRLCDEHKATPILLPERGGFAKACNAGLLRANGQVMFLCNNDIEFIEPSLQIMADAVNTVGAGVVSCRLLYPNMTIQHAGVFFVDSPNPALGIPGYWDHFLRGEQPLHPGAVTMSNVMGTGALLGITQWAKQVIGLLDDRFEFSCEDVDYNIAVLEAGRTSLYVGYTAAIHNEGATRGRTPEEKMALAPDVAAKEIRSLQFLFSKYPMLDWSMFAPSRMVYGA